MRRIEGNIKSKLAIELYSRPVKFCTSTVPREASPAEIQEAALSKIEHGGDTYNMVKD